jgi:cytochrome c553
MWFPQDVMRRGNVSRIKTNIAIGMTLVALLTSTIGFTQGDSTSPLKGREETGSADDSAESIKQRSGAGNPIAGRDKSQLCQGCHGEIGNSTEPLIPKLAGQYGDYISKEVRNYQAGTRSHQIMNAMAATLTDEDLADVAAYFASQKKMKGDGPEENQFGKNLFLHGDLSKMILACVNCHGVRGKGLDPKIPMFPVIGGQNRDYLRRQLIFFREGDRTNSPNGIMNRVAGALSDDDIESLVGYISAQ